MNRKERIARRLEGIDGEVHQSLLPNLVANRLLEEDMPRYTRASDLCESHAVTVQRYGMEGFENPDQPVKFPDRESRGHFRPDTQSSMHTEPVHSSLPTTAAPEQESKAARIARYKAERRRQLAERYGISLDQDLDPDYASRYTRIQKESDGSESRKRGELLRDEGRDANLSVYSGAVVGSPKPGSYATPQRHPDPVYDVAHTRVDSFSERERLMNLENQRRAVPPESTTSYMDVTSSFSARMPAKDPVASLPPSSPKMSRHSSLSSPKHAAFPGDMFIEQQAHSILSRQGSCVSSDFASTEADDEKLDDRAKLSVAAKRSLFRELEKNIDGGIPKPRSRNAAVDRRLRRTQDRSRTQPVTTEEVVIAATLQASLQQSSAARHRAPASQEARGSKQASVMEGRVEMAGQHPEEPDVCTLSLAQKMALFNRLAQPASRVTRTRGDSRQRRANARYQTQPITVGDMEQLQNGAGALYGATSASSAPRLGATVSSDHAGDIHIASAAVRAEPNPDASDLRMDMERLSDRGNDAMDLKVGKRRLPSPETAVRQVALPQPHTGRERWWEEEEQEEEEQQCWRPRGRDSSESHTFQEREEQRRHPREEGRHADGHGIRAISGELPDSTAVTSRDAFGSAIAEPQPPAGGQSVGPVQLDPEEEMTDVTIGRHMSIRERVALLKKSGEKDWRNRINKKQDVATVAEGEQQAQLWEAEQSFGKKVTASLLS